MKRIMPLVAALACGAVALPASAATIYSSKPAFLAASPGASLIENFEGVMAPQLDTPLAALVLASGTYVGQAGAPIPNVFVTSPGYTNFGAGNNPTTSKILAANGDEDFLVTLARPMSALGFDVYLNDLGPATVQFYNGTTLLGAIILAADGNGANNLGFVGLTGAGPITGFRFVSTNGGLLNTGIDNLVGTAVPEPSTWAMMIVGVGATGAMLRRRRGLRTA